jgi:hypothetical protein
MPKKKSPTPAITVERRLEMLDGRVYFTFDNWVTVFRQRGNRSTQVIGDEADLIRFIATAQETASP